MKFNLILLSWKFIAIKIWIFWRMFDGKSKNFHIIPTMFQVKCHQYEEYLCKKNLNMDTDYI